jgi:hypothetical protein
MIGTLESSLHITMLGSALKRSAQISTVTRVMKRLHGTRKPCFNVGTDDET